jgi:hypothetical protein
MKCWKIATGEVRFLTFLDRNQHLGHVRGYSETSGHIKTAKLN